MRDEDGWTTKVSNKDQQVSLFKKIMHPKKWLDKLNIESFEVVLQEKTMASIHTIEIPNRSSFLDCFQDMARSRMWFQCTPTNVAHKQDDSHDII